MCRDGMWIKRQEGYCLKEIAGVQYLLPYGQKVADQKKGILLNETGVFLWNELKEPMTVAKLAEKLVQYYFADGEAVDEIQDETPNGQNEIQDEIQGETQDQTQDGIQNQIQDQIRQDVKQFVQELVSLGILQECLRPVCTEDAEEATCVYPTKEPFVGYLEIAGMRIALYGSRELISSQFDAFLKDCASAQEKSQSESQAKSQNELQTEAQLKLQAKMPVQMQIEILQRMPSFHPNGKILIRNEELVVSENEQSYLVLFPSMNQIREAHMTADGRFVQIYVKGWDKEKTKEELFHAIRHFFLFFAQQQGFFALHSASIFYRGQAWLFSGHSGMGKSTHTNLWKEQFGVEIINGDLNLIGWSESSQRKTNESRQNQCSQFIVYGMPWCGTSGIASTKSYPLGGIVLLGRSDHDHFETLSQDQKIVRVMQRMISPVWTEDMFEANVTYAAKLAGEVPIYNLLCTKEPSAAQVMKAQIDQAENQVEMQGENQAENQAETQVKNQAETQVRKKQNLMNQEEAQQ